MSKECIACQRTAAALDRLPADSRGNKPRDQLVEVWLVTRKIFEAIRRGLTAHRNIIERDDHLTTQAQRRRPRGAEFGTVARCRRSLQRRIHLR